MMRAGAAVRRRPGWAKARPEAGPPQTEPGSVRQRENGQHAAELGVVGQRLVGADRAEALGLAGQPGRHADAGPAADAREHRDVLLAAVAEGVDVADDAGGRAEAEQLAPVALVHRLDVALERPVEDDVARGGQRPGPDREALRPRPDDLPLARVPGDEVAEVLLALRRGNGKRRAGEGGPPGGGGAGRLPGPSKR